MTEKRKRGVPLRDLDRSKVYRIGYTGRRWEVIGVEGHPPSAVGDPGTDAGACAEGASTATRPGRHAARGEAPPEGLPEGS